MNAHAAGIQKDVSSQWYGCKFVGDSVDSMVKLRHMRSDRQSTDLHYFHLYPTKDRVDLSAASNEPPSLNPDPILSDLLPSDSDVEAMMSNFGILVARNLIQYMLLFKEHFSDVVVHHIPHVHESGMDKVSEVVIVLFFLSTQYYYKVPTYRYRWVS